MKKALLVAGALLVLAFAAVAALLLARQQGWIPRRPRLAAAGSQMADTASFELAVYLLRGPTADPLAGFDRLLAREPSLFTRVASAPERPSAPQVFARVENDVQGSYAPPAADELQYFGRGLSLEEA